MNWSNNKIGELIFYTVSILMKLFNRKSSSGVSIKSTYNAVSKCPPCYSQVPSGEGCDPRTYNPAGTNRICAASGTSTGYVCEIMTTSTSPALQSTGGIPCSESGIIKDSSGNAIGVCLDGKRYSC